MTTSFSQGAIFYAGETISCTISFTHSLHETKKSNHHQRAHSFPLLDLSSNFNNRTQPNVINNRQSMTEVDALPLTNSPSRKMSLSSLASSTFSYLTGSTATKDPELIADAREWKDLSGKSINHKLSIETYHMIYRICT